MGNQSEVLGIVLVAPYSWGNNALEETLCRPLLPIAGRPLIWHTLKWLRDGGISRVCICSNINASVLRSHVSKGNGLDLSLEYHEDIVPRGPAGCVRDAASHHPFEKLLVVDGTTIPSVDLPAVMDTHRQSKAAATVVACNGGANGRMPRDTHRPVGIYAFSREIVEDVPALGYQDIKETLIPGLHKKGKRVEMHVVPSDAAPRITDAASYLTTNMRVMERVIREQAMPGGYVNVNGAYVHSSAQVDPTVQLIGPILIGPRCTVGPGSVVVGPTTIGADCVIERGAILSRSAVWDRCRVGWHAIIDHSILTEDATVEPEVVFRETMYVPSVSPQRTFPGSPLGLSRPVVGSRWQ